MPLSVVEDWILGTVDTYGTQREFILPEKSQSRLLVNVSLKELEDVMGHHFRIWLNTMKQSFYIIG